MSGDYSHQKFERLADAVQTSINELRRFPPDNISAMIFAEIQVRYCEVLSELLEMLRSQDRTIRKLRELNALEISQANIAPEVLEELSDPLNELFHTRNPF